MRKITRAEAKKLYEGGKSIYLNPSKMNPKGVWHQAMKVSKASLNNKLSDAPNFENLVNEYRYYNCSRETGLLVHFYKD
jgi:hypothetical protein